MSSAIAFLPKPNLPSVVALRVLMIPVVPPVWNHLMQANMVLSPKHQCTLED